MKTLSIICENDLNGYIAPTVWNSLPADLRAHSLPTFRVKNAFLPPNLLIDLYMPTATCFIFVCVCELGAGVGTGRDGIKGIGSNIMIDFLYILLLLIRHMYFLSVYIIHC